MSTTVFCRLQGKLARFEVDTTDTNAARTAVAHALLDDRQEPDGAILAVIIGGLAE